MRTCIGIEANFKAILKENIYNPTDKNGKAIPEKWWGINDYRLVNKSHHLSSYEVHFPGWHGSENMFVPFENWETRSDSLGWYQAYNQSKHDRLSAFRQANFSNLLGAVTGLLVLLSSQFRDEGFSAGPRLLSLGSLSDDLGETTLGGLFRIQYPDDWSDSQKYSFNWERDNKHKNRFQKFNYDSPADNA